METTENNVFFLLIYTFRADKCGGIRKTAKTPTIDSLCKNGIGFTQAIAATSTTASMCCQHLNERLPSLTWNQILNGLQIKS